MVLDRTQSPTFNTIEQFDFVKPEKFTLSNGIPVYFINSGSQELVRIELLFSAGSVNSKESLIAGFTNAMLQEGTSSMNAQQLAEAFDFYGSFLQLNIGKDAASVSLYTLNKFASETLSLLAEIIHDSTFPQQEIDTLINNENEKFDINLQKVSILAKRSFTASVFGENNAYGRVVEKSQFEKITREKLVSFYNTHYKSAQCTLVVAGKIDETILSLLENLFGKENKNNISK